MEAIPPLSGMTAAEARFVGRALRRQIATAARTLHGHQANAAELRQEAERLAAEMEQLMAEIVALQAHLTALGLPHEEPA